MGTSLCSLLSATSPQITQLERLMVGWTQKSNITVDVLPFCALRNFKKNLLKRLISFEKVERYIYEKEKREEIDATFETLNADLDTHCSGEKSV